MKKTVCIFYATIYKCALHLKYQLYYLCKNKLFSNYLVKNCFHLKHFWLINFKRSQLVVVVIAGFSTPIFLPLLIFNPINLSFPCLFILSYFFIYIFKNLSLRPLFCFSPKLLRLICTPLLVFPVFSINGIELKLVF